MSKQMTPCEKLGYKVVDEFTVIEKSYKFNVGDIISLQRDDGTGTPFFTNKSVSMEHPNGVACFISSVRKSEKLKPAKQALADAIHQNGGWLIAGDYNFVTSNHRGVVKFFHEKPLRNCVNWVGGPYSLAWIDLHQQLPNWHQRILSRDEYFTEYPEQVRVEICNETKHKFEVEMESESEMTIKVGDWYKNGEFPPVGEFCEAHFDYPPRWIETEIVARKGGFFIGWCESEKNVFRSDFVDGLRPLRTERDKAIDEMVDCLSSRWANCEEIAAHLYENGYRKEAN